MPLNIESRYQDYNLQVTQDAAYDTRSVLLIGTAEDGPVNVPIRIRKASDALAIFGSFYKGTLVKSIYTFFASTTGTNPDVRAVRIGGGSTASAKIYEVTSGSGIYAETSGLFALQIEALYPGEIYNNVSIRTGIVDNRLSIIIYNPKTNIESIYTYDTDPDIQADVHNAIELAEAINNDPNLNTIIRASVPDLQSYYEIDLTANLSGYVPAYDTSEGIVTLTLSNLSYDSSTEIIDYTRNPFDGRVKKAYATSLNNIVKLNRVYEAAVAHQFIDGEGASTFTLLGPVMHIIDDDNYIIPLDADLTSDRKDQSEFRQIIRSKYIGTVNDPNTFTKVEFNMYLPPDVLEMTLSNSDFEQYVLALSSISPEYTVDYIKTINGLDPNVIDNVILYVERNGKKMTIYDLTNIPVSSRRSSLFTIDWSYDTRKVTLNLNSNLKYHLEAGDKLYIDIDSCVGLLTRVNSLGGLKDKDFTYFYVAGNKIYFGSALPSPIAITYIYRREYEIGSDVELYDAKSGKLRFININKQPGFYNVDPYKQSYVFVECSGFTPIATSTGISSYTESFKHELVDTGSLAASVAENMRSGKADLSSPPVSDIHTLRRPDLPPGEDCRIDVENLKVKMWIGLDYTYAPEEMDLSSAISLNGGRSGVDISNELKYIELKKTFDAIKSYPADIVVLAGAYINDYVRSFNTYTGVEELQNAGIYELFLDYLDSLSKSVADAVGIMSVAPIEGDITPNEIKDHFDRLVNVKYNDATRPANAMALIGDNRSKRLVVTAFEPIISIPGISLPIATTGEVVYAGIIASLPDNQTPVNQPVRAVGMRYTFTPDQVDQLIENRYTTVMFRPYYGYRIAGDPTLAPYGSDYSLLSTYMETTYVVNGIRYIASQYLGSKNSDAIRNSLQQQIDKFMSKTIGRGIIQRGVAVVRSDPNKQVLGELDIDLTIVPAFEVKTIVINVKVTAT